MARVNLRGTNCLIITIIIIIIINPLSQTNTINTDRNKHCTTVSTNYTRKSKFPAGRATSPVAATQLHSSQQHDWLTDSRLSRCRGMRTADGTFRSPTPIRCSMKIKDVCLEREGQLPQTDCASAFVSNNCAGQMAWSTL